MRQPDKMIIYNLFPLLVGKVNNWESHLIRASEMGFNWIFVNPVQLPGNSGSLYSIKDYFSLNPLFFDGGSDKKPEEQLRDATSKAGALGLKMMVDLVINHCAADSDLLKEHPEWFMWEKKGKVVHPGADENGKRVVWNDLAKFDHKGTKDKKGLYQFFLKAVTYLLDVGFKGFRCDAAYQVPGDLWARLIREVKSKYPDAVFFAETLGCPADLTSKTAKSGFDYIFNSSKWWDFHNHWLLEQYNLTRHAAPSVSFPESHDTSRLCADFNGNVEGVKQRYLFSSLFSGGVMMPIGFEYGFRKSLHVVKTKPEDWEETGIDLTDFIKKTNEIKSEYKVFQEEAPTEILHCNNSNILVMWKASITTNEEALLIMNKDIWNKQYFYAENLQDFVQSKAALKDVSPEYALDFLPAPFNYDLRPGQGILLVTTRDNGTRE